MHILAMDTETTGLPASVIAFAGSYEEEAVNHLHKTSIEGQERALKELLEIHKTATAKEGKPN